MAMHRGLSILVCFSCSVISVVSLVNFLYSPPQKKAYTTEDTEAHPDQGKKGKATSISGSEEPRAQAVIQRARAALRKGDRKSALAILASIPEKDGTGHFAAGQMLVGEKAYAEAAREFGLARRTYQDRYAAGYDQALAFVNAGDYSSAIQTANELLNQGYQTAELAAVAATAYLKNGQTQQAYNAWRLATHLDPKNEDGYLGLCEIALDRDNYDLGLEVANIGLTHLPGSERLYVQRGVMHAMKGQFSEAEQDFTTSARLAPKDSLPVVATALVSMQTGHLDKAVELLRQASKQDPDDYFALYWFAEALLHAGAVPGSREGDEALAALQASIRNNPDFWHSRSDLGKVLLSRGEVDGAIEQLEKAAELNPQASSPLYLLAQAYRRKGNEAKAAELAARVSAMQTEEREAQTLPQATLKQLVKEGTTSSSSDRGKH